MVAIIHPEYGERLPREIGVTDAARLDYCPDVFALQENCPVVLGVNRAGDS